MIRETPLVSGETYHLYNRGAHKQPIFKEETDYRRFLLLLYIANNTERIHLSKLLHKNQGPSLIEIFTEVTVDKSLVDVMAYSLMPNHFHLVLRQKTENGITDFMKRIATGYSMYFNLKHEHGGVLFQGRFQSKCVNNEEYFRYIFSYVHLNPLSLHQPDWEEKGIANKVETRQFLREYSFSSFYDYSIGDRSEKAILSTNDIPDFLKDQNDFDELVKWHDDDKIKDRP